MVNTKPEPAPGPGRKRKRVRLNCALCTALVEEDGNTVADGLVVLADAFPLTPGHVLYVTQDHAGAVARAGLRNGALRHLDELMVSEVGSSPPTLFFEHGVSKPHRKAACIDHAHVHAVPLDRRVGLDDVLGTQSMEFARGLDWRADVPLSDVSPRILDDDYLWMSDSTGRSLVAPVSRDVPHQLVRRALGELLGIPHWDWRAQRALRAAHTAFSSEDLLGVDRQRVGGREGPGPLASS